MSFDKSDQDQGNQAPGTFDKTAGQQSDNSQPFLVIGERAFATPDDVQKKISSADAHIEKIEAENKAYRERQEALEKAANDNLSARELLEGIKSATSQPAPSETPSISPEEVAAKAIQIATNQVQENLKSDALKKAEEANLNEALTAAKEYFGDDYIDKVNDLGKEHGLDGKAINNLAKQSPKAFANLFLPKTEQSKGPSDGDYNSAAFHQQSKTESTSFMKLTTVKDRAAEVQRRIQEAEQRARNNQ